MWFNRINRTAARTNISAVTTLAIVVCSLVLAPFAHAEEGAKPEGAEGGAAGEGKEQHEFAEKQVKANALATKLEESDKHFRELVEEKEQAPNAEAKQDIIREMIKSKDERAKDAKAYEVLKSDLNLRYPSEGEAPKRRYQTETPRNSEEEREGVSGQSLDDMLTRTKRMIDKKFAPFIVDEPKAAAKRQPASNEPAPRLKLEK